MKTTDNSLSGTIIGCAMKVHRTLGSGFLESVYQKALLHELRKRGLQVESEKAIQVFYDGELVGDFQADIVVQNEIILELKAVQTLNTAHEVQLVNYLTATGKDVGLLFNFGGRSLEFKKKFSQPRTASGAAGITGLLLGFILLLIG